MTLLFRPMLAYNKTPKLSVLKYPLLASPKLDGIRCIMADGIAYTRSMKRVPNMHVQNELKKLQLHGLDGELMLNNSTDFNDVQSAMMSVHGKPDFHLAVFDDWSMESSTFVERTNEAQNKVITLGCPLVRYVPHTLMHSAEELQEFWDNCIEAGHEGAMARAIRGPYKRGRSTLLQGYLIKLKVWHDAEAKVTGVTELFSNENDAEVGELGQTKRSKSQDGLVAADTLGALCVTYAGKTFNVGSGFDAATRKALWQKKDSLIGKTITFKYLNLSKYGIPRHPIFKGFRYE
ncbi:DNA ligase [Pseudoalteromonas phage PH1]|uniref:DNA ligase n=1 Tax=Pseudoalteromonas phage PH1 TaxID=1874540 RepID=UPI0008197C1A|nr:DNA ligase [Pseudoalteromonas phage PH1]ANY29516.1 DNA ligase [Pseudoalteromonas phage PH1]